MVNYPECTIENLALIFQLVIILLSLSFSSATIIRIIRQKLYNNPFTFLILVIQSCYATMAIIDLLTKATALSNAYIVWCQVVGPLIYGAIVVLFYIIQSSFMLMELFVLMIYFTLSRKKYGPLNNNIKLITLSFVIGAICINCVGIPYYGVGFC